MLTVLLAACMWGYMFGLGWGNFWLSMAVCSSTLAGIALSEQRTKLSALFSFRMSHVAIGVAAAAVLYVTFFIGDRIGAALFTFAPVEVGHIYAMKAESHPFLIGSLLFLVIGPAEEIYWRGYLQERLESKYGRAIGWLVGGIVYAAVHLWAWNFMLFMAALICGLFWGAVYWRYRSLIPGIVSHAVWDVAIFILLPVR